MAYASPRAHVRRYWESVLSAESTSNAYELRDHTSDREKFFISASYDDARSWEIWIKHNRPSNCGRKPILGRLTSRVVVGIIYPVIGKYEKAIEESKKAIELDPDFAIGYKFLPSAMRTLTG